MSQTLPVPVALRLVARQLAYKLDLGGRSAQQFRELIKRFEDESARGGWNKEFPATPTVDFEIEIVNLGAEQVQVLLGGNLNSIGIELDGPGVLPFAPVLPVPAMMCPPELIPLAVGAKYTVAMKQLPVPVLPGMSFGRGFVYWIEPGAYTVKAFWNAGISPAPAGSQVDGHGFGQRTLVSDPVTVHVV